MRRLFHILTIVVIAFACSSQVASAQDVSAQESKKARLEKEIEQINRQLSDNASKSRSMLSKLTLVRKNVANRKALVAESDKQIRIYNDKITATQRQINALNARVDTLTAYYTRLIRGAYKNRDARVWYMYILASEDLGQAFRRYSYLKGLSSQMKAQAESIRETRDELEVEKERIQKLKAEAEVLRNKRKQELASLQKEEKDADDVMRQLKRNKTKYEKELASKKKQVDALDKEIRRLLAEAMKTSGKKNDAKPIDYKLASEFSANKGKLPWPAEGPVVDSFGQHWHPVFKTVKLPFNNGVSIALSPGTEVKAVFDGTVKQIVVMPGYNQCVLVQHGNYFSFYCKLKTTSVKAGDKVTTGQKIGVVDTINGDTQLHFQIWKEQSPQNPENWLRPR
ncbi:MAG: murein hydrolase activator EnvC family protein [Candidatus Cryptobacteroides sp.]